MNVRKILLSAALLAASLAPHAAGAAEVRWRTWDAGLKEAASTGKPILVDVYTDWCGWCKRMDRDVYAKPEVSEYLAKHFVAIKLDAESKAPARYQGRSETGRSIAQGFRVTGYPTTVFLRSNGEHLVNVPGYRPAPDFRVLLRYIGEDHIGRGVQWAVFSKNPEKFPER